MHEKVLDDPTFYEKKIIPRRPAGLLSEVPKGVEIKAKKATSPAGAAIASLAGAVGSAMALTENTGSMTAHQTGCFKQSKLKTVASVHSAIADLNMMAAVRESHYLVLIQSSAKR
ncbi:MAG: hypothetical protein KA436_10930 [Oligoflexales bacterium]|nr:hypothetical protein [Oligoflexales bacterium]